ncbi:SPRY domain-containing SOCS box protein 3-like isoform X2 [Epargyreus clarus]|uniref:SPRY domain-containing SOCS box protein 3-like isoform X2 n=1 Tax=Epargyreus clarus TaxID=520877 RepID=UPI003C2EF4C9
MLAAPVMSTSDAKRQPEPFCQCWHQRAPVPWQQLDPCNCGEILGSDCEWTWDEPAISGPGWLALSEDKRQVTFHPFYSAGTAVIKGDTPFLLNTHYYWEVKILTEAYGTDIIIGMGTSKLDITSARFLFTSLLGKNGESYGLSYTGVLRHNDQEVPESVGFCRGTIVGVRVDMWRGTLEYYLNRQPQGISFYNLRRHKVLYPMISSTAAQSSVRLVYAGSWRGSLLVDALKILASSVSPKKRLELPPGLMFTSTSQFWLTLPTDGQVKEEPKPPAPKESARSYYTLFAPQQAASCLKCRHWQMVPRSSGNAQSQR